MRRVIWVLVAALASRGVVAAETAPEPGSPPACREAGASFALGQRYSDRLARRARRAAGAGVVRKLAPGQAYTMEYRADRLNLDVDRRGRIRAIRCG